MHILVTCPFGLSSLVSKELKRLQLQPQTTLETAILLDTDRKGIYAINLRSRIANKVYLIVAEKELLTFDQLFDTVAAIDRKHYLSTGNISVQVTTKHSQLSSQRTIQSVAHKAILTSLQPIEG
jgi:23S rRNA G2445 N2-methylase RlmL